MNTLLILALALAINGLNIFSLSKLQESEYLGRKEKKVCCVTKWVCIVNFAFCQVAFVISSIAFFFWSCICI